MASQESQEIEEAKREYERYGEKLGEDHPDTLQSLNNLAALLHSKGEYDSALPLVEKCLEGRKRVLGDNHHDTLISLNTLALLFCSKGEYDRALPLSE